MTSHESRFEDRFDTLAAVAYRVAFRILGDRGQAEEVAQEALARAFARWRRVRGYDEAWVARVATNEALGIVRKRRPVPADRPGPGVDPARLVSDRLALAAALDALPRRQREVIALRYLADRSEVEVAQLLGCSVGTVKTHAHRGLAALRLSVDGADPLPSGGPDVRFAR